MSEPKATIRKFTGQWGRQYSWEGQRSRAYDSPEVAGVTENWMIGKGEGAENFAMRYYHVGVDGFTVKEHHPYDHGILILHGEGEVLLGDTHHKIAQGDIVYIPPDMEHQLINLGKQPMGFLCIIPAKRLKKNMIVWADENIKFDE